MSYSKEDYEIAAIMNCEEMYEQGMELQRLRLEGGRITLEEFEERKASRLKTLAERQAKRAEML